MREQNYLVGLDIGTDSLGYAVTNSRYELCKFHGEQMWGVHLFDAARPAATRRANRVARRRLDRRQQRVQLVQELFAREIAAVDADFFRRIQESYLYPQTAEDKVRLFGTLAEQRQYAQRYPTIHHLIVELMKSDAPHDVRLVYLACAWLVAHRGHFLSEVDREHVEAVTEFETVYQSLVDCIEHDGYHLPWRSDVAPREVAEVLKAKSGVTKKEKALTAVLFGEGRKAPREIDGEREFNYACVVKLLAGGKAKLQELYGREEYAELEINSLSLDIDDEGLAALLPQLVDEDRELFRCLKQIHDWCLLVDVLGGHASLSEAKVAVYDRHHQDLRDLKRLVKAYLPQKYHSLFRAANSGDKATYVAYVGKTNADGERTRVKKAPSRENFCKYIRSLLAPIRDTVLEEDGETYARVMERLEANAFMPKQVDGDNRVIPYQLYWHEMKCLLQRASGYLPFLTVADADGLTVADKLLSVMAFRVPYYVGPLRTASSSDGGRENHWMVRKAEGRILPWNFTQMVDLDKSEEAFIARMTNTCTYLPGEPVLPKCSLVYSAFEVLTSCSMRRSRPGAFRITSCLAVICSGRTCSLAWMLR